LSLSRDLFKTVLNVLSDGTREENWFLLDDCHVFFVARRVKFIQILTSIMDVTDIRVIESFYKLDYCGLTTSTGTHESHCRILLDIDAY